MAVISWLWQKKIYLYLSFPRYFPKNTTIIIHNSLSSIKYWPSTSLLRWHAKRCRECYLIHSSRLLMACLLKPQNHDKHHGNIQTSSRDCSAEHKMKIKSLENYRGKGSSWGQAGTCMLTSSSLWGKGPSKEMDCHSVPPQAMMSRLSWQLPFSFFQFP